jgi:hypothetical protein
MAKHIVALYADLIDGTDADGQQLVADLHAFFNPAVPSRLQATPPLVAPRAVGPKWHWPRTALVAALAIFALVGATYLALPLLQSLWSEDRGLQHVTQAGLARNLDLRQTIDGVTVHVQKAYADANRVAVGYSVEFPPTTATDRSPGFGDLVLTDDAGGTHRPFGSMSTGDSPLGAQVAMFEAPGVTGARDIAFTLTIPKVHAAGQDFRGPWVFNFTLPVAAARVVERTLTFTRPGVELTFTRIVVAPSATRFHYRVRLEGATEPTRVSIVLFASGRGLRGYGPYCQPDGECVFVATEPLLDADALQVDAVLGISEYVPPGSVGPPPRQIRIDGVVLPLR